MSDPRFDRDPHRFDLGHDYDRYRAGQTGAGGAWTAGLFLAVVLLIGGLMYFGADNRTTQVASNPNIPATEQAAPPAAPARTAPAPQQ